MKQDIKNIDKYIALDFSDQMLTWLVNNEICMELYLQEMEFLQVQVCPLGCVQHVREDCQAIHTSWREF